MNISKQLVSRHLLGGGGPPELRSTKKKGDEICITMWGYNQYILSITNRIYIYIYIYLGSSPSFKVYIYIYIYIYIYVHTQKNTHSKSDNIFNNGISHYSKENTE